MHQRDAYQFFGVLLITLAFGMSFAVFWRPPYYSAEGFSYGIIVGLLAGLGIMLLVRKEGS